MLNKTPDWNDPLYVMSSVQSGILKRKNFRRKTWKFTLSVSTFFFICQNNDPEHGFSFSFSLFLLFFIFFLWICLSVFVFVASIIVLWICKSVFLFASSSIPLWISSLYLCLWCFYLLSTSTFFLSCSVCLPFCTSLSSTHFSCH